MYSWLYSWTALFCKSANRLRIPPRMRPRMHILHARMQLCQYQRPWINDSPVSASTPQRLSVSTASHRNEPSTNGATKTRRGLGGGSMAAALHKGGSQYQRPWINDSPLSGIRRSVDQRFIRLPKRAVHEWGHRSTQIWKGLKTVSMSNTSVFSARFR